MITGPTGTGKELIARSIHRQNPKRSPHPLVVADCAAWPPNLFESQLFGHTRGAFTGAQYEAIGCFRAADKGSIFLDEIGELELSLQAKLLRVIQEKTVTPLGSHQPVPVDVRLIAATNRNLEREVAEGRFRADLYYRLNVVMLETTFLSQRREDIPVLAEHFLDDLAAEEGWPLKRLSPSALKLLQMHDWPGNVRELFNALERATVLCESGEIGPEMFPRLIESVVLAERRSSSPAPLSAEPSRQPVSHPNLLPGDCVAACSTDIQPLDQGEPWLKMRDLERYHIEQTLRHTYYNQTAAARLLGMSRFVLIRKINEYGIESHVAQQPRCGHNRGTADQSS